MGITGADILNKAESYSGIKYFEGNPQDRQHGFDCSGIVQQTMKDLGVSIPRTTSTQLAAAGLKNIGTDLNKALQGDVIHYVGHEEIFIGWGRHATGMPPIPYVFSEATNGTVSAIRPWTGWPIIGIVRYADSGPGPKSGILGATKVGGPFANGVPIIPLQFGEAGASTDQGKVSGQLTDIVPGVASVLDIVTGIAKALAFLADPGNWWRVGIALLGTALLIMGLLRLTQTPISKVVPNAG